MSRVLIVVISATGYIVFQFALCYTKFIIKIERNKMQSQIKQRSPIAVLLLSVITFGIYGWYWIVKVKGELNRSQNQVHIPTAWIWVIPIIGSMWYEWKFSEATDVVTSGKYSAPVAFILIICLGAIGYAILQDGYNKIGSSANTYNPAAQPAQSQPSASTTPVATTITEPSQNATDADLFRR